MDNDDIYFSWFLVGIVAGSTISARLDICSYNLHEKINVLMFNLDLMFWPLNRLMHQKIRNLRLLHLIGISL